ncbi:GDPmannose 4,6-dehydratase [Mangrovibacterium marinum]|uniref:GDP-mannose 4,6-dehydratase n=1 Tax=Mangrovibacterium marinum TaxID=1639118 RepID=A0A2T5BTS8_9BACT|nr:GDP-mannose 4,6-dehydratase [Mangrovibacterium marinum]PTN02878.1 GDPmannose 4,6-dehydratase [Mangrovibacterium marinum]
MKKALITGVTGQDGAYLTKLLISEGYKVFGTFRRNSSVNFWRLQELGMHNHPNLKLVEFDLTDQANCIHLISEIQPDEVYNLAAQSFVGVSFKQPLTTASVTGIGALHLLEAIRIVNPKIKFYQASTSEMFGKVHEIPQKETTFFHPRSPYGVAKLFAHWATINYRESYDIFGVCGILFNHESPLRGKEFVTRKITDAVAGIKLGTADILELGNLDAKRDWGYAEEYVECMYRMMQQETPDTFVIATNRTETVRDFVTMAFKAIDINIAWEGTGENEIGINKANGETLVKVNPEFYRPAEVELLIGDPSKAKTMLGWAPKTTLEELCKMMVEKDIERNEKAINAGITAGTSF